MVSWPELLLVAVAPSIFLLWFFRHKDRFEHEPIGFMLKVFLLGAVWVIPATIVELFGQRLFQPDNGLIETALFFFIIVGPVEELGKYFAVRLRAYNSRLFDSPFDGIVLGVSGALGFATIENIAYIFTAPPDAQLITGIVRAFLSVPGHAFWGAIIGFYLGQAKYLNKQSLRAVGLGIAALLHATFDTTNSAITAFAGDSDALAVLGIIVLFGIVYLSYFGIVKREIKEAEHEPPRPTGNMPFNG